jgi:raffinose/stachyose/melibiose transport system permease protein
MTLVPSRARTRPWLSGLPVHGALILYALIAVFPVVLILMNSVKSRQAIFGQPLHLPSPATFDLRGYETVWRATSFPRYFWNSGVVTIGSLLLTLLFGAMAAFALTEFGFRGSKVVGLYLTLGLMIPIRLGTVSILKLVIQLGLMNTHLALILVYTAMNLPVAILVLSVFMRVVSKDLKDAARIDGAGEFRILFEHVIPLIRPALATAAIFTMIPVWNDLWFPLILANSEPTKTVILGAQQFIGQYFKDWNAMLAALTLSIVPTMIIYLLFSRQLIAGLTRGAVK